MFWLRGLIANPMYKETYAVVKRALQPIQKDAISVTVFLRHKEVVLDLKGFMFLVCVRAWISNNETIIIEPNEIAPRDRNVALVFLSFAPIKQNRNIQQLPDNIMKKPEILWRFFTPVIVAIFSHDTVSSFRCWLVIVPIIIFMTTYAKRQSEMNIADWNERSNCERGETG